MPNALLADKSDAEKSSFLVNVFFGVAQTPTLFINPFIEVEDFVSAKLGDLKWPTNPADVDADKDRLATLLSETLKMISDMNLSANDARDAFNDDTTTIRVVVQKLLSKITF